MTLPLMNLMPVLAIILTNSGGEGKTTWSEILAALAYFAGLNVTVADIDPGNRGFLNRNGDRSAISLDWAGNEYDASDPEAWFDTHVRGKDLTVLDTGANMLPAAGKTNEFLMGLLGLAKTNGVRVVFYCVTSPNKAGSDGLVELMHQRFSKVGDIAIVQNDRDGSGAFKASLGQLGADIIKVPHFPAALQAVRLRRNIPLDEVLRNPEPGYERATALIAKTLLPLAKQKDVQKIIGEAALAELTQLSAGAPQRSFYTLSGLAHGTNESLTANERLNDAWVAFHKCEPANDEGLFIAARELRSAMTDWDRIH